MLAQEMERYESWFIYQSSVSGPELRKYQIMTDHLRVLEVLRIFTLQVLGYACTVKIIEYSPERDKKKKDFHASALSFALFEWSQETLKFSFRLWRSYQNLLPLLSHLNQKRGGVAIIRLYFEENGKLNPCVQAKQTHGPMRLLCHVQNEIYRGLDLRWKFHLLHPLENPQR